jgi:hypothetical protein
MNQSCLREREEFQKLMLGLRFHLAIAQERPQRYVEQKHLGPEVPHLLPVSLNESVVQRDRVGLVYLPRVDDVQEPLHPVQL